MHNLLRRQIKKLGVDADVPPSAEQWSLLLAQVSQTYAESDQDRCMLERSLDTVSHEMQALYDDLRAASKATIDEKHAELEESLALARAVQESVADGILVIDLDGVVVANNRRFAAMWRVPDNLLAGKVNDRIAKHIGSQVKEPKAYLDSVAELMGGADVVVHHDVELLDGRVFERYAAPMVGADGRRRGCVACYRDVTEARRLASQRVVVSERMAAVGQLVASVAHEINNPLSYVAGNVEHVSALLAEGGAGLDVPALLEALEDARHGVERIRVIVNDLRALSRIEEDSGKPTDVREVLTTSLQMASNHIRHRASIERDLMPVPNIIANESRLAQVFLNLLVNAAQAIPDGRASENTISVATRVVDDGRVRVEVRDSGCGIDKAHLERIFDPFFTTKPVGSGTGLGLSICRGLVEKMGGTISVESTVGEGSCFTVELPIARPSEDADGSIRNAVVPMSTGAALRRRVLVVDDDAQVRRALHRVLSKDYDVETSASVDEALVALGQRDFDAVLCDVMMPNRTGLDLHTLVNGAYPEMLTRLIFMTGGAFAPTLQAFFEQLSTPRLDKPLDARAVREAIDKVVTAAK